MRRKILIGTSLLMAVAAFSGCGKKPGLPESPSEDITVNITTEAKTDEVTTEEKTEEITSEEKTEDNSVDYDAVYGEVVERLKGLLKNKDFDNLADEEMWLVDVSYAMDEEILSSVGYKVQDISGDGIPELIITNISDWSDGKPNGKFIYSIYTCVEDKPVNVICGAGRTSYGWISPGEIFVEGSSGAAYSMFGTSKILKDGTAFEATEMYFTSPKDSYEDIGYYHNTTGVWDAEVSEELSISPEEFWNIEEKFFEKVTYVEVTPFAARDELTIPAGVVTANYADDVLYMYGDYIQYTEDDSEYSVSVVFATDYTVSNFVLNSLFLTDVDENGNFSFDETKLYELPKLESSMPLVVTLTFPGDLPSYGISYTDNNGNVKRFALEQSGMDGSLVLTEY